MYDLINSDDRSATEFDAYEFRKDPESQPQPEFFCSCGNHRLVNEVICEACERELSGQ